MSSTAYPSGLHPIASGDLNGKRQIQRRVSRTDLDFEQALRAEGTVVLTEGLDVNSLGMDTGPSPMNPSFGSPTPSRQFTTRNLQPSTPTIVPPTPSPVPGPSSARTPSQPPSLDAQDTPERQTNRRSMYRSPGTSSSPDLATLLRKAKEKGAVVGPHQKKDKRRDSPPPVPPPHDRPSAGGRPRSSTSYSSHPSTSQVTPPSGGRLKPNRGTLGEASPDWVLTSPRQAKENGSTKVRYLFTCSMNLFLSTDREPSLRLERRRVLSWEKCLGRGRRQYENDRYAQYCDICCGRHFYLIFRKPMLVHLRHAQLPH
jgi:PH/SEC7 domain-containing protein